MRRQVAIAKLHIEILLQNENIDPNAHNKYGTDAFSLCFFSAI